MAGGTQPSRDKWAGGSGLGRSSRAWANRLGTATRWGHQVMGNSWRTVCHCCQLQGEEHLLPALSEACSFPMGTGTKTQPH